MSESDDDVAPAEPVSGDSPPAGSGAAPDAPTGAAERPESASPTKHRGCRRPVVLGLAALLGLLLAAAVWFYFAKIHHTPTAHRHVPSNAVLAVRAEAAEIVLFRPVRTHLWPLLIEGRKTEGAPSDSLASRRRERIAELTGIHLPEDLREVVIASVDPTSSVILIGGKLDRGKFVPGIEQLFREEGVGGWRREGELLVHLLGPALAQADDGTLIAGTSASIVQAALAEGPSDARVPLPVEGAMSFRANRELWSGVARLLPSSLPGLSTLSQIEEASGSFTLADQPIVRLSLTPRAGVEPTALKGEIDELLTAARVLLLLTSDELGGAKEALGSATVEAAAGAVELSAPWPIEPLDRAVERLAHRLRGTEAPEPAPRRPWSLF